MSESDPARLTAMRSRIDAAAAELRGMRCADREAAGALRAVRLTAHTLECWWRPALDALVGRGATGPDV